MIDKKEHFLKSWYDALEKKIIFLNALYEDDHRDEALLLCCCYIEAMGNQLYFEKDTNGNSENFYLILDERGENELFGLVHPKQATEVLKAKPLFKDNIQDIENHLRNLPNELYEQVKFKTMLEPYLDRNQMVWLDRHIYKITISAISYERIRSPSVHDIWAITVSFDGTTYNNKQVPSLDFPLFYTALENVFRESKKTSIDHNAWLYEQ